MPSERPITRRNALRAAGSAIGGVVGVSGLAGTAVAASGYCLKYDWVLDQDCPTDGDEEGPTEEAGTPVYEACTDGSTQYYFVCEDGYEDECEAFGDMYDTYVKGYVPPDGVEPC